MTFDFTSRQYKYLVLRKMNFQLLELEIFLFLLADRFKHSKLTYIFKKSLFEKTFHFKKFVLFNCQEISFHSKKQVFEL